MTGLILLLTAAFGGLQTAPKKPVDQLAIGEPHTSEQATVTVERVAVVNSIDELQIGAGEQKSLVLVTTITNLTDSPLPTSGGGVFGKDGFRENFSIELAAGDDGDGGDEPARERFQLTTDDVLQVLRTDDATVSPTMQPNVPSRVAFILAIDSASASAIASGDPVTVTIYDLSFGQYSLINRDAMLWGNPVAAAQVEVTPEALGAASIHLFNDEVTP